MSFFVDCFVSATSLLKSMDAELCEVVWVSVKVSLISTFFASLLGIPLGLLISLHQFRLKRLVITVLNSLLALPTVLIGLFVYSFLCRKGIFGSWDLLYTQTAITIGQIILIVPLVTTFTIATISRLDGRYKKTAMTLGANRFQTSIVILREARFGIISGIAGSFGRVISEIGVSMMLGGNIRGFTRTITTAIALEYDKGEFVFAVALGIVLMVLSLAINILINFFQGKMQH
ncbi:MAG: ABC transporter permease [Candidatus Riflebacteria bacterium]|nr:ABC transporter permease [Candidatus Riflebacteria bacterium]